MGTFREQLWAVSASGIKLLLHELGHAVGLQHTVLATQVMLATLASRATTAYGSGDLTGLRRVARAYGCIA